MIYPWGALLIALFYPSWQLIAVLIIAYSQLLVATDWARLYVWATPVMCVQAGYVNTEWMIPLAVAHWFNPKQGTGV